MEIVRVIVESVDAPENKYNYWLDLRTNTLKRWHNDEWIPISTSVVVQPSDVTAVTLIEDRTPTKSVAVDNEPIVKLRGDKSGVLANTEEDGSLDVFVKNTGPFDVKIVDGSSDDPQKVEVTNNYLKTEIHSSEDDPIIVKFDNTNTNEVKVINSSSEAIPITNSEDAIYNPLYVTSTGNKPIIATLNPQTVNSVQIQGSGDDKNRAEVTDNKALLVELPDGVTPIVYARPYGGSDFSVSLSNVGTTSSITKGASLNVNVTNTHVPVKFDDSNILKETKETLDNISTTLSETPSVEVTNAVTIDSSTPIDINIASSGNVPVTIDDILKVQVASDVYQVDNSRVPVLLIYNDDPSQVIETPVWVLKFLLSRKKEDFRTFFTYMYAYIAMDLKNSSSDHAEVYFHIPCFQGNFNGESVTFSMPCIVNMRDVHFKKTSETLFSDYSAGTIVFTTEDVNGTIHEMGLKTIYPYLFNS